MNLKRRTLALSLCLMLLLPVIASAQADGQPIPPSITTAWSDDGQGGVLHAYSVTFADDGAYEISVDLNHMRNGTLLPYEVFTSWSVEDETRIADIQFNTSLAWGDEIDLNIDVIGWNGDSLDEAVSASRSLTVGTWNHLWPITK